MPIKELVKSASVLAVLCLNFVGCGYTLGYRLPGEVVTLHVPNFTNSTFPLRREIEFDLTRAVKQELQLRSDVRLGGPQSEAYLEGEVLSFVEGVLTEGPLDSVQESSLAVVVRVRLLRSDGSVLFDRKISDQAQYSTLRGETLVDARSEAIQAIAERIVAELEAW